MPASLPERLLKVRVMSVVTASLFILFGLAASILEDVNHKYLHEKLDETIHSVEFIYQQEVEREVEQLASILQVVTKDAELPELLQKQDQAGLLFKYAELYADLNKRFNITHFYFSNTQRINILRAHSPGRSGGEISRYTMLQAEKLWGGNW